jgi:hypothetical protein
LALTPWKRSETVSLEERRMIMKLSKRWHLVKVGKTPLFQIRSDYFNMVRTNHSDKDSRLLGEGFEEGYKRALIDLGIKGTLKAKRDV